MKIHSTVDISHWIKSNHSNFFPVVLPSVSALKCRSKEVSPRNELEGVPSHRMRGEGPQLESTLLATAGLIMQLLKHVWKAAGDIKAAEFYYPWH